MLLTTDFVSTPLRPSYFCYTQVEANNKHDKNFVLALHLFQWDFQQNTNLTGLNAHESVGYITQILKQ